MSRTRDAPLSDVAPRRDQTGRDKPVWMRGLIRNIETANYSMTKIFWIDIVNSHTHTHTDTHTDTHQTSHSHAQTFLQIEHGKMNEYE